MSLAAWSAGSKPWTWTMPICVAEDPAVEQPGVVRFVSLRHRFLGINLAIRK